MVAAGGTATTRSMVGYDLQEELLSLLGHPHIRPIFRLDMRGAGQHVCLRRLAGSKFCYRSDHKGILDRFRSPGVDAPMMEERREEDGQVENDYVDVQTTPSQHVYRLSLVQEIKSSICNAGLLHFVFS